MSLYSEDSTIADALTTFGQLLEKRDFDGALNYWQSVKGQVDGFTYWYNLGTLQTMRGQFPEARFSFEKARHLTLYSDATERQLRKVTQELAVDSPTQSFQLGPVLANSVIALGPMKIWFVAVSGAMGIMLSIRREWSKNWKWGVLGCAMLPL